MKKQSKTQTDSKSGAKYRVKEVPYQQKNGKRVVKTYFYLPYRDDYGKRKEKSFSDIQSLRLWYNKFKAESKAYGDAYWQLSQDQFDEARRALEIATNANRLDLTLDRAMKIAIEHSAEKTANQLITLQQVVDEYLEDIIRRKRRPSTIWDVRYRTKRLCEKLGDRAINSIKEHDAKEWLDGLRQLKGESKGKPYPVHSLDDFRGGCYGLFKYAIEEGYAVRNPFTQKQRDRIAINDQKREIKGDVNVWDISTVRTLFAKLEENEEYHSLIPALALSFWQGIRTSEIQRMTWSEHIDLKGKVIKITGDIAKKRKLRRFEICENTLHWLRKYKHTKIANGGKVAPDKFQKLRKKFVDDCSIEWIANGARHTFASCHFELYESADKTTKITGHSAEQLKEDYLNIGFTKAECEDFFSIVPAEVAGDNVIDISKAG